MANGTYNNIPTMKVKEDSHKLIMCYFFFTTVDRNSRRQHRMIRNIPFVKFMVQVHIVSLVNLAKLVTICRATGHSLSMGNTKVLTQEQNWQKRKVKKAIYVKQRAPTMNRDQGYHLPAIYSQITPPKPEPYHMPPELDQNPQMMGYNVAHFKYYVPK